MTWKSTLGLVNIFLVLHCYGLRIFVLAAYWPVHLNFLAFFSDSVHARQEWKWKTQNDLTVTINRTGLLRARNCPSSSDLTIKYWSYSNPNFRKKLRIFFFLQYLEKLTSTHVFTHVNVSHSP